jgi:hypothetical protein
MKMIIRGNTMDGGVSLVHFEGQYPNLDATIEDNKTRNLRGDLVSFGPRAKPQTLGSLATGVAGAVVATAITRFTGLSE